MSDFDSSKNYYEILGADESASRGDLQKLYKRLASHRHPDLGGSEEEMKTLNEAYRVLSDAQTRREYDEKRIMSASAAPQVIIQSAPAAREVGLLGHGLSAFLCLLLGTFLLLLVRIQWFWFLWPMAILAVLVILFGVFMARSAMRAVNASLSSTNPIRSHTRIQEALFWTTAAGLAYGVYLVLTTI